jgi:energy-coupling factor transporter ATP-binding protein EcfA2
MSRLRWSCARCRTQSRGSAELGLPDAVRELAEAERGMLITGTTGSGKSTTLAAMVDHINRTMEKHIVTIEDPIEFLHRDQLSSVSQREIGMDTASLKRALRRVLREDPDAAGAPRLRCSDRVDISANGLQQAVTRGITTGSEQVTSFRKALASDGRRLGTPAPALCPLFSRAAVPSEVASRRQR